MDGRPFAPVSLTATAGVSQVSLTWQNNPRLTSAGTGGYIVYRKPHNNPVSTPDGFGAIRGVYGGGQWWIDSTATPGVPYTYFVTATMNGGSWESERSNYVTATPLTTPPAAGFNLTVNANSVTVDKGNTFNGTFVVQSSGNFSGTVNLTKTVTNASNNVAVTTIEVTNPASVSVSANGQTGGAFTIRPLPNCATGTYTVTLTGASGSLNDIEVINVTVTDNPDPDFSLSFPNSLGTIVSGQTKTASFSVTPQAGFVGDVQFTVLPWNMNTGAAATGITATFTPNPVGVGNTTASGTLTVTTTAALQTGPYALYITGKSGSLEHPAVVYFDAQKTDYNFSVTPTSIGLNWNSFSDLTASASVVNVASGTVTIGVEDLPANVTVSFPSGSTISLTSPTPLPIRLTAGANVPEGTHWIAVTSTLNGEKRTTRVAVQVNRPAFTLTGSPVNFNLTRNTYGDGNLTVTPYYNYQGNVELTAVNPPDDVTVTFDGQSSRTFNINGSGTYSTPFRVSVGNTAVGGTMAFNIRARDTATGEEKLLPISITIPAAGYDLSASPTAVTVARNTFADVAVSLTPYNGINQAVSLSTSGLPSGLTATFTPSSPLTVSGSTPTVTTLHLAADGTVTPGTYVVTITGTSSGLANTTRTVTVTVPTPTFTLSASPTTINVIQGESATTTITVNNLYGWTTPVQLSALPASSELTFAFGTNPTDTTSLLTVTTTANTPIGTYTGLQVSGTADGKTATTPITVVVKRPPPGPVTLAAVAGFKRVRLNWSPVPNAIKYNVYRRTTPGATWNLVRTYYSATQATHIDSNLTPGTTYYYIVRAANETSESADSNEVSAVPFDASPVDCGSVVNAALATNDPISFGKGAGFYADRYQIIGLLGQSITIKASSVAFDTALVISDAYGNILQVVEDGGGTDAITTFTPTTSDTYLIEVTSNAAGETGAYSLALCCGAAGSGTGLPQLIAGVSGNFVPTGTITPSYSQHTWEIWNGVPGNGGILVAANPSAVPGVTAAGWTVTYANNLLQVTPPGDAATGIAYQVRYKSGFDMPEGPIGAFVVDGIETGLCAFASATPSLYTPSYPPPTYGGSYSASFEVICGVTSTPCALGLPVTLTVVPTTLASGTAITATVTLSGPALSGGQFVTLLSSDPAVLMPPSVFVPGGASSVQVTVPTSPIRDNRTATLTADFRGTTAQALVNLKPNPVGTQGGGNTGGGVTAPQNSNGSACGPMDVVFVLDRSGSMSQVLANVKQGLVPLVDAVERASGGDYRLALVTFGNFDPAVSLDETEESIFVNERFAPQNRKVVEQAILNTTIEQSYGVGGGWPEPSDEALRAVIENLPSSGRPQDRPFATTFRDNARRVIFLVTDNFPGGLYDNGVYYPVPSELVAQYTARGKEIADLAARLGIQICSIYVPPDLAAYPYLAGFAADVRDIMQTYATTTYGTFTETQPNGDGVAQGMIDSIATCAMYRPSNSRVIHELSAQQSTYDPFTLATGGTEAIAGANTTFSLSGILPGTVTAAHLRRIGRLERRTPGVVEWIPGARSVANSALADYSPAPVTLGASLPKPYPYSAGWHLSAGIVTEIATAHNAAQGAYALRLSDVASGVCGPLWVNDTPRLGFPSDNNTLSLLVKPSYGNPRVRQAGTLRITIPDILPDPAPDKPTLENWQILLDGQVVAANGANANGWNVTPETSPYRGVLIAAPANARIATSYEVRYRGIDPDTRAGSGLFDVVDVNGNPGDFTVDAVATSLSIPQGDARTTAVNLTSNINEPVYLWVTGLPKNTHYKYTPASVTGNGSSTLEIAPGYDTPTGTYALKVVGVWRDVRREDTLSLTVTTGPTANFQMGISPKAFRLLQGQTTTATVTVTPLPGFNDFVDLSVVGLPAGVEARFDPASLVINRQTGALTSTFTIYAQPSADPVSLTNFTIMAQGRKNGPWKYDTAQVEVLSALRVNSGGPVYNGVEYEWPNHRWEADDTTPSVYTQDGSVHTISYSNPIGNTYLEDLYKSVRESGSTAGNTFTYTFNLPLADAPYRLHLHFAELEKTAAGQRKFHVSVNGTRLLSNFDVYAQAENTSGQAKALEIALPARSTADKKIVLTFEAVTDKAQVAAVQVALARTATVVPPTGVEATPGANKVLLKWNRVAGANSYVVRRSTTAGGPYTTVGNTYQNGDAQPTYTDYGRTNGTAYYYVIRAVQSVDGYNPHSPDSAEVSATPSPDVADAPVNLTATPGNGQVVLAWQQVYGTGIVYRIKRSVGNNTSYQPLTTTPANLTATTYTDTTVRNGTVYYYKVYAEISGQAGLESNEASAMPFAPGTRVDSGYTAAGTRTSPMTGLVWQNDNPQSGAAYSVTNGIISSFYSNPTEPVAGTTDPELYRSYRRAKGPNDYEYGGSPVQGEFTYTITGLTANATYSLRLHFMEGEREAGERFFNVEVNGAARLTRYDVAARTGGKWKAHVVPLTAVADATGKITARFVSHPDSIAAVGQTAAMVCALEVVAPESAETQPIECGQTKTGNLNESDAELPELAQHTAAVGPPPYYADRFTFSATKGQKVRLTLRSTPQGTDPYFNPYIYLVGPDGQTVAVADDSAIVYNAESEYSIDGATSGTPVNGVWTYWYTPSYTATSLVAYPDKGQHPDSRFTAWYYFDASVRKNMTSTTAVVGTVTVPAGWLHTHPGSSGERSVVRFTAPAAGNYAVSGRFANQDVTSTGVSLRQGTGGANLSSTVLWSDYIEARVGQTPHLEAPFSQLATLAAGDTLDFVVDWGTNGNYYSDSTGLQAQIVRGGIAGLNPWDARIASANGEELALNTSGTYTVYVTSSPNNAPGVGDYSLQLECLNSMLSAPNAPTELAAQAVPNVQTNTFDSILLTWRDNSDDETGFEIRRTEFINGVAGTPLTIATAPAGDTARRTWLDPVAGEKVYAYEVRAIRQTENGTLASAWVGPARESTKAVPPVVAILSPLEGDNIGVGAVAVRLAAHASDRTSVSAVTLRVINAAGQPTELNATNNNNPSGIYTVGWTPTAGTYFLQAEVRDGMGLINTSTTISVQVGPLTVATPVIRQLGFFPSSPNANSGPPIVEITTATPEAVIYYTTDNSEPVPGGATSQKYTGPFTLLNPHGQLGALTRVVKARAFKRRVVDAQWDVSTTTSQAFTFKNGTGSGAYGTIGFPNSSKNNDVFSFPMGNTNAPYQIDTVIGIVPITGATTGSVASWSLSYRSCEYAAPVNSDAGWTPLQSGAGQPGNGVLGEFDSTVLPNGLYEIRLRVFSTDGTWMDSFKTVVVSGGQKVGPMNLSLVDLTLPAPGFPIQISRSYDSTDKREGDFGVGWRVGVSNLRVHKSATNSVGDNGRTAYLGEGWTEQKVNLQSESYYLQPVEPHYMTLSLPGGAVYGFYMAVTPESSALPFPDRDLLDEEDVTVEFKAIPGTQADLEGARLIPTTALGVPLSGDGRESVSVEYLNGGDTHDKKLGKRVVLYNAGTGTIYDRAYFMLTTRDGVRYYFNVQTGITKIVDRNGNELHYDLTARTDGSYYVSAISSWRNIGNNQIWKTREVILARQPNGGYITSITDANNKSINYGYTGGDLTTVANRLGKTTTYQYDADHNLTKVTAPATAQANGPTIQPTVSHRYDPQGRLVATIDAAGNAVTQGHAVRERQTVITDPLGNQSLIAYDNYGNVYRTASYLTYKEGEVEKQRTIRSESNYGYFNKSLLGYQGGDPGWEEYVEDTPANRLKLGNLKTRQEIQISHNLTSDAREIQVTKFRYDGETGDLTEVSDPKNATGFTTAQKMIYNAAGQLVEVRDPRRVGTTRPLQKNEYDVNGNLIITWDGVGNSTVYSDGDPTTTADNLLPDGSPRQVTNPLGQVTRFMYYEAPDGEKAGQVKAVTTPGDVTATYDYDANGKKIEEAVTQQGQVNENGGILNATYLRTTFVRDAEGRVLKTISPQFQPENGGNPDDVKERTVFNEIGKVSAEYDKYNRLTSYLYTSAGKLNKTESYLGVSEVLYDENSRHKWSKSVDGEIYDTTYDSLGRIIETKTRFQDNNALIVRHVYDDVGRVVEKWESRNNGASFEQKSAITYNVEGQIKYQRDVEAIRGNLSPVEFGYDNRGLNTWIKDQMGNYTVYKYDKLDRVIKTYFGSQASYGDDYGGSWIEVEYDGFDHKTLERTHERAANGSSSARDRLTTFRYNPQGQLDQVTQVIDVVNWPNDPDHKNLVTRYGYDTAGNKIWQQDAIGTDRERYNLGGNPRKTYFGYDITGRMVWRKMPEGEIERWGYSQLGRLRTTTDFMGRVTTYRYFGVKPDNESEAIGEELTPTTDVRYGSLWQKAPDPTLAALGESPITYNYYTADDPVNGAVKNRRATALYGEIQSGWAYDERGRLKQAETREVDPQTLGSTGPTRRFDYRYDVAGNKTGTTVTLNGAGEISRFDQTFDYDGADRLWKVKDTTNTNAPLTLATYGYNPNGSLDSVVRANGVTTTYGYNRRNELWWVRHDRPQGAANLGVAKAFLYESDLSGKRTAFYTGNELTNNWQGDLTPTSTQVGTRYEYDPAGRLTKETRADTGTTTEWEYDKVGNRRKQAVKKVGQPDRVITYDYDDNDRLKWEETKTGTETTRFRQFDWNLNGQMIASRDLIAGGAWVTNRYEYNFTGTLRQMQEVPQVTGQGYKTVAFNYDADGNRINLRTGTRAGIGEAPFLDNLPTRQFAVDTQQPYAEVAAEWSRSPSGQWALTKHYAQGIDRLASAGANGAQAWYVYDGLGSTRALTNGTGNPTDAYDYEAFGAPTHTVGTTTNDFLFNGQQYDENDSSLPHADPMYYLRARYYTPGIGRFATQDPIIGNSIDPITLHPYIYGGDSPIVNIDPSGEFIVGSVTSMTFSMKIRVTYDRAGPVLALHTAKAKIYAAVGITVASILAAMYDSVSNNTAPQPQPQPTGSPNIGNGQQEDDDDMPVYKLHYNGYPEYLSESAKEPYFPIVVQQSIAKAIGMDGVGGKRRPTVLNYDAPEDDARRRAAYAANGVPWGKRTPVFPIIALAIPPGVRGGWDEYPFNSTREGGNNAIVTLVPDNQNKRHGNDLQAFYNNFLIPYYIRKGNVTPRITPYRYRVVIQK